MFDATYAVQQLHTVPLLRTKFYHILITAMWTMMLCTQVYRYDSPSPRRHCGIFGDPRVTTFDLIYYTTYLTGNFIYARSTSGLPFEVTYFFHMCILLIPVLSLVLSYIILQQLLCSSSRIQ